MIIFLIKIVVLFIFYNFYLALHHSSFVLKYKVRLRVRTYHYRSILFNDPRFVPSILFKKYLRFHPQYVQENHNDLTLLRSQRLILVLKYRLNPKCIPNKFINNNIIPNQLLSLQYLYFTLQNK